MITKTTGTPPPPVAARVPKTLTAHGHQRFDEYYWLRDDQRKDPRVLAYLEAENEYTRACLTRLEPLQALLFKEIKGRIKKDDMSVPYLENGYWHYARFEANREYAIHCRRQGNLQALEEVVLDENDRAVGHEYYDAAEVETSIGNDVLAFSEDTQSRRIYTLRFRDLVTGANLPDEIEGTSGEFAWAMDNRTVFFVRKDPDTLREYQIWRHVLGVDPQEDVLVFEEGDPEFSVSVWRTRSRNFLVISSYQTRSSEHRVLPAHTPTGDFQVFLPRERGHEHDIDHAGQCWYVRTNWQAQNFRLMTAPAGATADRERWQEVIPARPAVYLRDFSVFRDFLVVAEREQGLPGLRVLPRDGQAPWRIDFDEPAYHVSLGNNPEYDNPVVRFDYTSLTTPHSEFDYDMRARERVLLKQEAILGGFDKSDYVSQRVDVIARDGSTVAVSLVQRRDLDRRTPRPLVLYGYGSYGLSMDASFSSARLSLLDRGFIFAIAHIRGGQELGRQWYEDGKLLAKKNTFTDFVDCAEHLIRCGFTSADRLVVAGGSAGGLLIGAVVNMRPELFRVAIAHVPFVDVVTTMLDESIPLTTFEYDEWGNPNDEQYYRYMLSYSPYDNVRAAEYPAMFVFTGLHDPQVQYWEPAKWVARLRAVKTDDHPLLLHVNMDTGHGGASGRFERHREQAMEYAFLIDLLVNRQSSDPVGARP